MSKEKITKNRIAPKQKKDGDKIWSFKASSYDNRSSCSVSAGNDYGKGFTQPIGDFKTSSVESGPIPQKSHVFRADEFIESKDVEG